MGSHLYTNVCSIVTNAGRPVKPFAQEGPDLLEAVEPAWEPVYYSCSIRPMGTQQAVIGMAGAILAAGPAEWLLNTWVDPSYASIGGYVYVVVLALALPLLFLHGDYQPAFTIGLGSTDARVALSHLDAAFARCRSACARGSPAAARAATARS